VDEVPIPSVDMAPCRSPSAEKALQPLAGLAITEACVSGSCDICLYQKDPCSIVSQHRENSHSFRRSGEKKNK